MFSAVYHINVLVYASLGTQAAVLSLHSTQQYRNSSDELTARLDEISREVEATGTYTPTAKELEFGARTAWRNASRCIGRIQWQNLNFFDYRHVKTTREMFEACLKHIEFATNSGNIRLVCRVHNLD